MKRIVQQFIASFGCSSSYSGKTKTLYINDLSKEIELKILDKFGYALHFKLKTN